MSDGESMDDAYIYSIEVTREDILPALTELVYRLTAKYNIREQKQLWGFALGPNTYKSFEYAFSTTQRFHHTPLGVDPDTTSYMGYQILCSPFVGIIPLFKRDGWVIAHEEAKKWMSKEELN